MSAFTPFHGEYTRSGTVSKGCGTCCSHFPKSLHRRTVLASSLRDSSVLCILIMEACQGISASRATSQAFHVEPTGAQLAARCGRDSCGLPPTAMTSESRAGPYGNNAGFIRGMRVKPMIRENVTFPLLGRNSSCCQGMQRNPWFPKNV